MRDEYGKPVTDFTVPERAPASVLTAVADYERLCVQLVDEHAALRAAEDAIEVAHREDVQEIADALKSGTSMDVEHVRERAAREARDSQRTKVEGIEQAVDEAGDRVLDAIADAQEGWLSSLESGIGDAEDAYRDAIADARRAVEQLNEARVLADWLRRFRPGACRTGGAAPGKRRTMQWNGAHAHSLFVPAPGSHGSIGMETIAAVDLLDALERAVQSSGEPVDDLAREAAAA